MNSHIRSNVDNFKKWDFGFNMVIATQQKEQIPETVYEENAKSVTER